MIDLFENHKIKWMIFYGVKPKGLLLIITRLQFFFYNYPCTMSYDEADKFVRDDCNKDATT